MPRAAVLGHPVRHSLSPVLHQAAYAALGLPSWQYSAIDCDVEALPGLLVAAHADTDTWVGFSCTMPLKRLALTLASAADPLATAVGAANTLVRTDAGWTAAMTDVAGITEALAESGAAPVEVTLIGSGGTAQAALGAVARWGLGDCAVLVRDRSRTTQLRATAERLGIELSLADLDPAAPELDAELVISTVPRGAADALAPHRWRPNQRLLDAVYDPWPTRLADSASQAGATVISGALMLLHQAVAQVGLMTGLAAPQAQMRAALLRAAPGCGLSPPAEAGARIDR